MNNGPVRENFLNASGKQATGPSRFPYLNTSAITPYSAIFCRQCCQVQRRNHKKTNLLQKEAQKSLPNRTRNSLFQKILRVSPCGSRLCRDYTGYGARNINEMKILQKHAKKNGGSPDTTLDTIKKGGPREAALSFYSTKWPDQPDQPQNQEVITLWEAGRAGSGIAGSARPARGSGSCLVLRPCGRLLRGRLLPWPRVRRSLAAAPD